jgi:LemA protein
MPSPHYLKEMHMGLFVLIGLGLLLAYAIAIYNGLVQVKNGVRKAWANIDVLLKQRHDEIPKLVATCNQYMGYEQATLKQVIDARARVASARESQDVPALNSAEKSMRAGLSGLFALAEAYPELKANEQFVMLQARISALEESIADRREFYNDCVNINNVSIEQFPGVVVARIFNFKPADLLTFAPEETTDVDVKALFKSE